MTEELVRKVLSPLIEVLNGKIVEESEVFATFKRKNFHRWGDIEEILEYVLEFHSKKQVYTFRIACTEIEDLTNQMAQPSSDQLTSCRADAIAKLEISIPQRIIKSSFEEIQQKSAVKIQTAFRKKFAQMYYAKLRRMKKNFISIACAIRVKANSANTRRIIKRILDNYPASYTSMEDEFKYTWSSSSNYVEIHLCSLGIDIEARARYKEFGKAQSDLLIRLARLKDPNLRMMLITYDGIDTGDLAYYVKLLTILGIKDIYSRVKVLKLVISFLLSQNQSFILD